MPIFAALTEKRMIMKSQIAVWLCWLPMALWAQEERPWSEYLNEVMTVEDVE